MLLLVSVILYLGLGLYFSTHEDKMKKDLTALVNEKISGEIKIGDLDVSLFQGFPSLTIQVKDVIVKDSLWNIHKRTLLKAGKVYAKVSPWAILSKSITVDNLTIENATVDIYVDDNGYSNVSVFSKLKDKKPDEKKKSTLDVGIDNIRFTAVTFISENHIKKKNFNFKTSDLKVLISHNDQGWNATIDVKTFVNSMTFNTLKGSFAKNKIIEGEINAVYNSSKKQIGIYSKELEIGGNPFEVKATFGASKTNSLFNITLFTSSVQWKEASSLLSDNIQSKLNKFDLLKPIDARCEIKGNMKVKGNPSIHVIANVKDNELIAKRGIIRNCTFTGEFINSYVKNNGFGDPNTAIFLHDFKGDYNEIPFTTKDFKVFNLKKPVVSGLVKTNFDVGKLNSVFNKDALHFLKGKADVSVQFKANVVDLNISKPFITGFVNVDKADFTYGPRNFNIKNCNLKLEFTPDKLNVRAFDFETQSSKFHMKGYAGNFMNLYYDNPEKIVLNCDINCPQIDLSEFIYLLSSKKQGKSEKNAKGKGSSGFLERTISSSNLALNLNIDKLIYKKFTGTNTVAKIAISNDNIIIQKVAIQKGRGNVNIEGEVKHNSKTDHFNLKVKVAKVDIRDLLYSFDNFGSATITHRNITGIIDLNTHLNGIIADNGGLAKNSLKGDLQFNLRNGAFIDFKPIENVGKKVFPKRNFKKVTFENINGDFKINNGRVYISPMKINNSVLNFDLSGVYAFQSGTDLNIEVYLRNPENDKGITNAKILKAKRDAGLSVHFKAVDGPDGKVKMQVRSLKAK
ncbi:AsmA family protein [Flavobacterium limnosediminis]|nr:AsmA-like C-terminal region-containing protein [Flavobacterium limnosediminis]